MTAQQHGELDDLAPVVATRARGLLAERQMKQTELGLVMGITKSRMSDRLNGTKDFDLNELPRLAQALDTSIEYLLGLTDVRESKSPRPENRTGADVRHQGLEPRTRWISDRLADRTPAERHLTAVPDLPAARLPGDPRPRPAHTPGEVVDLAGYRIRSAS